MVGGLRDVITYAEFQIEIFMGYDFTGGRIFDFPIDFSMGLTTVQRYCAACDDDDDEQIDNSCNENLYSPRYSDSSSYKINTKLHNKNTKINLTRRALDRAHLPPTMVFRRLKTTRRCCDGRSIRIFST